MNKEHFCTRDLHLSAFLKTKGFYLEKVCPGPGERGATFSFSGSGIQEAVKDYYNSGQVVALEFRGALRTLTSLVKDRGLNNGR